MCEMNYEEREYAAISETISKRLGSRFMDPPDGVSVTIAEQVDRLVTALKNAESQLSSNT